MSVVVLVLPRILQGLTCGYVMFPYCLVFYIIMFEIFYKSLKTRSFIPFKWLGVCFVPRVADPKYILEGCHSRDTFIILTKTPFFIKSITKTTTNVNINRGEDGIF